MPNYTSSFVQNVATRSVVRAGVGNWATAQLAGVATYEIHGTTAAVVGDDVYVVHPHFGHEDPPSVERVVFQ